MAKATTKIWAVVPAAGVGRRMGYSTPKQYLPLAGKTMAETTLERLLAFAPFEQLVVAIAKDDPYWSGLEISNHPRVRTCVGGEARVNSVLSALNYLEPLAAQNDWVMVHDIARPCIRLTDIDLLLHSVRANDVGGLLALPVTDTVKRGSVVDSEEGLPVVISTEPRQQLWRALTPQLFRYNVLKDSLQKALVAKIDITDESSAIEFCGYQPLLIPGHRDNIKVTQAEDLALAEQLLIAQAGSVEPEHKHGGQA